MFHAFDIYDNVHKVGIVHAYARTSSDSDKQIMLHGLRFSRVPSKKEWMNRKVDNIHLPKYPSSMEELLANDDPNKFCFARAMDIDSINAETVNIHYAANQFWEQDGPGQLILETVKTILVNEKAYHRVFI